MKPLFFLIKQSLIYSSFLLVFCQAQETYINSENDSGLDYRNKAVLSPVKNQGDYGSCGVFAAMGVLEAQIRKHDSDIVDLSEQYYINASDDWDSNSGVSPMAVFDFIKNNGIILESRLPYLATQTEEFPEGDPDYSISSYKVVPLEALSAMESKQKIQEVLIEFGPVATAMDILSDLPTHKNGLYIPSEDAESRGGHWVVIVGWKDNPEVLNGGYWIVKNSAGKNWGEDGYFRIPYTICNIDRYVMTYAIYK